jgi:multiple sugar transport system substrate-binding protein
MKRSRTTLVTAAVVSLGLTLAGCSGGGGGGASEGSPEALDAALEEGGTISFWSWTPAATQQAEAFMEEYPNVTVEVVESGGASDQTLRLQNALTAGSGIPDVVSMEYQTIPQFQLAGELLDLTPYGFDELEDLYSASTWDSVTPVDGVWGLPQDSGPMAMFYNETVFTAAGIEVPATWDEYVAAGEALKAANPAQCIVADNGNAGFVNSMIWQAGGRPYSVVGETVNINLQDEGSQKWAESWNRLVENGLNCEMSEWSDEWFASLSDGTIATVVSGAWMPGVFEASAPAASGQWRVAPTPTYDGTPANANIGGTGGVIPAQAENPDLGAAFLRWLLSEQASLDIFMGTGGFPSTVANLESTEFLEYESEYFGGQKINEVLVAGIDSVGEDWSYLPWQPYANSIAGETVGQSYLERSDLNEGLVSWQDANIEYAERQGFTVSTD